MQELRNDTLISLNGGVESHSVNVSKGFSTLNPYFLVQYIKSQVKDDFNRVIL
ncbi:MAG: hypothetical protein SPI42_09035 [Lactobacillus johnsonii]|uniref:hypothetical protein n=1 Tax=Lactobacillus johnsonii TaxID=33959 RepID=UPI0021A7F671|nr:hypothetical protein [Lactobacillus johnsonii]MDD7006137.1 hypothetical protein [Lactobacillus johnsonii]MDY6196262.1 hypothetical protein [Lactobacillus johnsonii]